MHLVKKGATHREDEPKDHALGRSREGFTTKIHWVCDPKRLPLMTTLSPGAGAVHESTCLEKVLQQVSIPVKRGRPRNRPQKIVAHGSYHVAYIRKVIFEVSEISGKVAIPSLPTPPIVANVKDFAN